MESTSHRQSRHHYARLERSANMGVGEVDTFDRLINGQKGD